MCMSPLKYLTVRTRSSIVASSSHKKIVCGCCWKAETVHMWLTPSSIALCKARALWAPVIRIITCKKYKWTGKCIWSLDSLEQSAAKRKLKKLSTMISSSSRHHSIHLAASMAGTFHLPWPVGRLCHLPHACWLLSSSVSTVPRVPCLIFYWSASFSFKCLGENRGRRKFYEQRVSFIF